MNFSLSLSFPLPSPLSVTLSCVPFIYCVFLSQSLSVHLLFSQCIGLCAFLSFLVLCLLSVHCLSLYLYSLSMLFVSLLLCVCFSLCVSAFSCPCSVYVSLRLLSPVCFPHFLPRESAFLHGYKKGHLTFSFHHLHSKRPLCQLQLNSLGENPAWVTLQFFNLSP